MEFIEAILLSHPNVLQVHEGEKPFKCDQPECERSFTSKAGLERHINDHTGNNLLQYFVIMTDPGSYFRRVSFLMSRVSQEVQIFDRVEPTQC